MVKFIKAELDIFNTSKHKWSTGDYKAQRTRTRSTTYRTKISLLRPNEDNIFLEKPKDDRTYGERVDDRLEAGLELIRKDAVKMVEATVQLGAISPRKRRNANRGVVS